MTKPSTIVVIEDDVDDQDVLKNVFNKLSLGNEVIFLSNGEDALENLSSITTTPLLILSDINMPRMDGFELRSRINDHEINNLKDIPFMFFLPAQISYL